MNKFSESMIQKRDGQLYADYLKLKAENERQAAELARLESQIEQLTEQRDALARAVREHNNALLDECLSNGTPAMGFCTDDPENKPVCGACPLNYKIDLPEQSK